MREQAVDRLLRRAGADWSLVRDLIAQGQLVEAEYRGKTSCIRRVPQTMSALSDHFPTLSPHSKAPRRK
jgi:hypothetical protein